MIHPAELRAAAPPPRHPAQSWPPQSWPPQPWPPQSWPPQPAWPQHHGPPPTHAQLPGPGHPPHPAYGPPPVFVTTTVNTPIVVRTSSCPHALHLVLTLLTCGLWLPIWIIDAIARG
ncbi:hypothetical protein D7316_05138 [Gordonia insulae]|uniref:Uncharacterized protein n=1 Tax=Gordonia insulae TaxID=2420509 RepID=A0A3G8JTP2_9ACTN|nr:hypothetical protein D7316_05138 [Gordonia insulae]